MTTHPISSPLDDAARATTTTVLNNTLSNLVDLHLVAKQAHWNVIGKQFRAVHLQLDELVTLARGYADDVAERAATLGEPADGRATTISQRSDVPDIEAGWRSDEEVIAYIVDALEKVINRLRQSIDETDKTDPVTQDLLIEITAELEKAHWMWQAQIATR